MTTSVLDTVTTVAQAKAANWTRNAEARAHLAQFKALKEIEKAGKDAEKERKALEPLLKAALNGADEAIINGVVAVKLSSLRTTHLWDYKMLEEAFPEAYNAIHSTSHFRYLIAS